VEMIAAPIVVSPAFEDRDAVWRMVQTHSPYPMMAALAGYGEIMGGDVSPWFRSNWALEGQAIDDETMSLLHHEPFVEAAQRLFGAAVVRPTTIVTNVNGPMAVGPAHVDTPTFRGLKRSEVPVWLLVVMGASGLFTRWSVRVAGAITWFYDRDDWEITNLDGPPDVVPGEDVRVSILWKALTFRDVREARVYDDHEDDLALETVVDMLRADLARRGHRVEEPSDPYRDAAWSQVLTSVYMLGR